MVSKKMLDNIVSFGMMLCFGFIFFAAANTIEAESSEPEPQHQEVVVKQVDKIALKQLEMRNTIVFVQTRRGSGSGTIIDRLETSKNKYEYRVLTNAHVTNSRFVAQLFRVNSLTGKIKTKTVDTGCVIITFNHEKQSWKNYTVKVVSENVVRDLALLSFISREELSVAKIPTSEILGQIRVFDEVFAIGCQLGRSPTPTFGIISQILSGNHWEENWLIYGTTTQLTPGSSGGGLFKEHDGHYYLVGIPCGIAIAGGGQMVPHLAYAISMTTAISFIDQNAVSIQ